MNKIKIKKRNPLDNISASIAILFRYLRIPATLSKIKKTIHSHPDYPGLLSLSESLREWGIKTEAVRGTVSDLSETDCPGLAHLKSKEFVLLEEIRDGQIFILNPTRGREQHSLESFSKIWSGVVLRVFPEEDAGEKDYQENRRKENLLIFSQFMIFFGLPVLFILALFFGLQGVEKTGSLIVLASAKMVGLILCGIMVLRSPGNINLIEKFCHSGKKLNCQRVLNSPAGKIFGIPMADLGLIYFSGGILSLLISVFLKSVELNLTFLAFLNILCLPYTLFSIIYQAFVVHSWCWLCLVVQGLFWVEFYFLYSYISRINSIFILSLPFTLFFSFFLTTMFWMLLRSLFIKTDRLNKLEVENKRIRQDPDCIHTLLSRLQPVKMGNFPSEVEIGHINVGINLTLMVNPLCIHCGKALRQLQKLMSLCQDKIKATIRFLVKFEDKNKTETEKLLDYEVSKHILLLLEAGKYNEMRQALYDWFSEDQYFSKGKFEKWKKKYSHVGSISSDKVEKLLKDYREWAVGSSIKVTPTIFLNNLKLPEGYQIENLKYYLLRQV